ncbi:224_t:CDS:1, partial [Cetraspora pellucida]
GLFFRLIFHFPHDAIKAFKDDISSFYKSECKKAFIISNYGSIFFLIDSSRLWKNDEILVKEHGLEPYSSTNRTTLF